MKMQMERQEISSLKREEKRARKKGNDTESAEIAMKIIDLYSDYFAQSKDLQAITELNDIIKELCSKKDQTMYFVIRVYQRLIEKPFNYFDDNELFMFYSILHGLLLCNVSVSKEFAFIAKFIESNDFLLAKDHMLSFKDLEALKGLTILRKLHKKFSVCSQSELKQTDANHSIQSNPYNNTSNDFTHQISTNPKETLTSTNRSFNVKLTNSQKDNSYIPNNKLPFITINFSALLSLQQIINVIGAGFAKSHFINIFTALSNDIMVFQYKESNCLTNCLRSALKKFSASDTISTHQIRIRLASNNVTNKTQYEHFLEFKCVTGKKKLLESAIVSVIKHMCLHIRSISICKRSQKWSCDFEEDISVFLAKKSPNCKFNKDYNKLIEEEGSIIEITNTEASNYYEIYRILSQENYDVGRNISKFLAVFKEENKDVIEASNRIPSQMKQIINIIDESLSTFNNYFNYARDKRMSYVHPAVDKYLFNKVYFILYNIYSAKYKKDNEIFTSAKMRLNQSRSINSIMAYLEIKPKYRCDEEKDFPGYIPYKPSIDLINKIEFEQSPMEKLETLMKSSLEVRNTILSSTKGKEKLESMDDELPLIIYITTQVTIPNLPAELHMIEDYITYTRAIINKETKVLTNLFSSIFYITNNSWND